MRWVCLLVVAAVCLASAAAAAAKEAVSPELTAARKAFDQNIALGDSLAGKAATAAQVTEAQGLFDEALTGARAAISTDSRSADAHRLAGLVLCTAYRPVVIEPGAEATATDPAKPAVTALLRGASKDCEEGLAELRSALRLAKSSPDCVLDYGEALLTCGDPSAAQEQATAVWDQRATLPSTQLARAARLLAKCAQANNTPDMELIWLRQVLQLDPKDQAAGRRLAKLAGSQTGIAWMPYEAGTALAAQASKPMLIDFTAKWCGWCKKLEQEVFPDKDMIALSQQFICIRVDGDERSDLTSRFKVDGYPTTLVLSSSGQELHRIVGYVPLARYMAEVKQSVPSG